LDAQRLKEHILDNNLVPDILAEIGCHSIKVKSDIIQCANPDGDNATAICVYKNENLTTLNYTRQLLPSGQTRSTDLIDLVSFIRNCAFFETMKWLCGFCGLDYYADEEEVPESLQILQFLNHMNKESIGEDDDNTPLQPIDTKILSYYLPVANKMWQDDGISLQTQYEFSVMYDDYSNRIILPLFDPFNTLVGIKGRLMKRHLDDGEQKYLYMQNNFNKSKFLFGLNKTMDMIQKQGYCPIFEGEKSVMIAYEHGVGSVAVCGSRISKCQANLLTRLNVPLIVCFDKDKTEDEVKNEIDKFLEQVPVYYMIDKDGLLGEKESPADDWNKWEVLIKNNVYKNGGKAT
jgi:DNA primase